MRLGKVLLLLGSARNRLAFTLARGPSAVANYWRRQGVTIGLGTHVGRSVVFGRPSDPIVVGAGCVLTGCTIVGHDASTNRQLGLSRSMAIPVTIEDNCYVGQGALILMGVTVGKGSIVGAGAVCALDVPPGSVVVGNPARVVGTVDELVARRRQLALEHPEYFPGGLPTAG